MAAARDGVWHARCPMRWTSSAFVVVVVVGVVVGKVLGLVVHSSCPVRKRRRSPCGACGVGTSLVSSNSNGAMHLVFEVDGFKLDCAGR